jgi:hypothetical protein
MNESAGNPCTPNKPASMSRDEERISSLEKELAELKEAIRPIVELKNAYDKMQKRNIANELQSSLEKLTLEMTVSENDYSFSFGKPNLLKGII